MDKFTKAMVATVVIAVCAVIMALAVSVVHTAFTEPYCPQEDSCSADYRDGAWHITERDAGSY